MTGFKEKFDALLNEKKLPANYQEIQDGNHLYRFQFKVSKQRKLIVEVIIQDTSGDHLDAQIIYRHVHLLKDYNQRPEALEAINELNESKTGYYNLYLAGDGEIYLRNLLRSTQDPFLIYEVLVIGSSIARVLQAELEQKLGESANPMV
ncbi:hypothetical protein [Facklamia miroungae]|uniref:Sensory transduction regulator n=1 Tax=Facklamia miroungae TaxID=120956 RepID=A0A1G7P1R0_9LACT|nr:hypothetical protein [Facklamia miroungae]NKZ28550.1 hypothetical protein [Facklamia miroungae]SDF80171.1 hypothetical protein SAMN05421791_10191 [Facklamia miroungae]